MLTDTEIKRAIKTATIDQVLNDGAQGRGTGSLRIRIRPAARGTSATWFAWWSQDGKPKTKQLGRYPAMSLLDARKAYQADIAPLLAAGKDPGAVVAPADMPTVERMFQGYVASMKAKGRVSAVEVERALLLSKDNAADALGRHRPAAEIESADVAAYVAKFYQRGHRGAADKARSYLGSAFAWAKKSTHDYTAAERQDWGIKANPAADVPKDAGAIKQRDRNLSAAEMAKLWTAEGIGPDSMACIMLLITLGQRVQETLRIHGEDIDLAARTWTMPAAKTKGRKAAHTIPLPPLAMVVIHKLIDQRGKGSLFPARTGSKGPYIGHASIQQAIDRWNVGEAKMPAFQTRDLRRTWKSRTADAGIDRFTRDLIQQHAKHDTGSRSYDRADYLPQMTEAMMKWDAWLRSNVLKQIPQKLAA